MVEATKCNVLRAKCARVAVPVALSAPRFTWRERGSTLQSFRARALLLFVMKIWPKLSPGLDMSVHCLAGGTLRRLVIVKSRCSDKPKDERVAMEAYALRELLLDYRPRCRLSLSVCNQRTRFTSI